MNINDAKQVAIRTHLASLGNGHRASGLYLESGPGIGKSEGTFQYAAELAATINEPVGIVIFMLATISSVDVRGFLLPQKQADGTLGSQFSTPPWYPTKENMIVIEPNGTIHPEGTWPNDLPRVGVLFLDEFAQAEDEVKKPAAELIYRGSVGTSHLPAKWRVIAAGNRLSDRSGAVRELMFIVNRRCRLSISANLPAWLEWANKLPPEKSLHYLVQSFAQKNPDLVFRDAVPAGNNPFCTPRTLCLLNQDLMALRSDADIKANRLPLDDIAREVAAGWIGDGEAAQLYTHFKYADELPDIADIVADASKAKLPPNKDAQMVAGYMLAHNLDATNAKPIMEYVTRLNIEMQCLSIRAMLANSERGRFVVAEPKMVQWLAKNKQLLTETR